MAAFGRSAEAFVAGLRELAAANPEGAGRLERGVQLALHHGLEPQGGGVYLARGSRAGDWYLVDVPARTCECGDFRHRQVTCKHLLGALLLERLAAASAGRAA